MNQIYSIDLFLAQGQYLRVHRELIRKIGYRDAVVLTLLIDRRNYWRQKGELDPEGGFFKLRDELARDIGTGVRDVDSALANLTSLGLISSRRFGLPAKKHYYIHDQAVISLIQANDPPPPSSAKEQNSTCSGSTYIHAPEADLYALREQIASNISITENTLQRTQLQRDTVNPISAPVPPAPPPPQPGPRRPSGRAPSTASPIAMDIAGKWHAWAMQCRPYLVSTSVKSFAKAIDEIMVRHSINPDGMLKIMEYVQRDEFWSKNAVSPCGLVKKSANGLYKIENILAQMQKDRGWKHKMMLESGQFDEVQF
jgi:hypothetical protein